MESNRGRERKEGEREMEKRERSRDQLQERESERGEEGRSERISPSLENYERTLHVRESKGERLQKRGNVARGRTI